MVASAIWALEIGDPELVGIQKALIRRASAKLRSQ